MVLGKNLANEEFDLVWGRQRQGGMQMEEWKWWLLHKNNG